MDVIQRSRPEGGLSDGEMREVVASAAGAMSARGKKVLVIVPDHTRTCPLPAVARAVHAALAGVAKQVDFIVALGTHPPMTDEQMDHLFGCKAGQREKVFGCSMFFNHRWKDPSALAQIGMLRAADVRRTLHHAHRGR